MESFSILGDEVSSDLKGALNELIDGMTVVQIKVSIILKGLELVHVLRNLGVISNLWEGESSIVKLPS